MSKIFLKKRKGNYIGVHDVPAIYRLYHGSKVVFLGETDNLLKTIKRHERNKSGWGSYDYKLKKKPMRVIREQSEEGRFTKKEIREAWEKVFKKRKKSKKKKNVR